MQKLREQSPRVQTHNLYASLSTKLPVPVIKDMKNFQIKLFSLNITIYNVLIIMPLLHGPYVREYVAILV